MEPPDSPVLNMEERRALARLRAIERRRQRGWLRPLLLGLYKRFWVHGVKKLAWLIMRFIWRKTLGRWIFVKTFVTMAKAQNEAAALRLVASSTSIPVPRLFGCISWRSRAYLFTSRVPGVELNKVWFQLSDKGKSAIIEQLSEYTAQLRALQTPYGSRICSAIGTPVYDGRLGSDVQREIVGDDWIFDDEDAMNAALRGFTSLEKLPADVQRSHATKHPIHFTHADLQPRNIMVDRDGTRVTAIFDWAFAGWYPAHWEYRKATWPVMDAVTQDWLAYVPRVTPAYEMEIQADNYLADRYWRL